MPPSPFRVSPADSAWLRMENPTNPMTITGVLGFGGPMTVDALRRFMTERVLPYERFRMRVDTSGSSPRWVPAPGFRVEDHVVETELPEPGGKEGLQRLVSTLMSEPLDLAHVPWTMHLVHGVDGDGSAAIVRLHHVIGDGIALMHVLLSASDEYFDAERLPDGNKAKTRRPLRARLARTARGALSETRDLLLQPSHLVGRLSALGGITKALTLLLAMRPDAQTVFKGTATPDKRAAWTDPIPLDRVKAIGLATDAKVNDVLMAAAAGALRSYLQGIGQPVDGVQIRVATPFNVRPLDRAHELGNSFGLVFVTLPVDVPTPEARLRETQRRMDAAKRSREPAVVYGILQSIGSAPGWAHQQVVDMFAQKASAVLTNVPGPSEPIHIAGVPVTTLMFWVPQAGDIGLGISILSLAGTVRVGICTDAAYVADPEPLALAFVDEFQRLADHFAPGA